MRFAINEKLGIAALAGLAGLLAPAPCFAQNTSSVSGADVKDGHRGFEYRAAYSANGDGRPDAFAHRLSYEHAFSGAFQAKVVVLQRKRESEAFEIQNVSIELLNQFLESEETGGWDSAIRVDALIPAQSGHPGRVRVDWLNKIDLDNRWQARANIYVGHEIGDHADDGFTLETREEITYELENGMRIGAQLFDNYNTTAHFGDFDAQRHQLGPVVKGELTERIDFSAGVLFGLSAAAPDTDFRLFVTYSL